MAINNNIPELPSNVAEEILRNLSTIRDLRCAERAGPFFGRHVIRHDSIWIDVMRNMFSKEVVDIAESYAKASLNIDPTEYPGKCIPYTRSLLVALVYDICRAIHANAKFSRYPYIIFPHHAIFDMLSPRSKKIVTDELSARLMAKEMYSTFPEECKEKMDESLKRFCTQKEIGPTIAGVIFGKYEKIFPLSARELYYVHIDVPESQKKGSVESWCELLAAPDCKRLTSLTLSHCTSETIDSTKHLLKCLTKNPEKLTAFAILCEGSGGLPGPEFFEYLGACKLRSLWINFDGCSFRGFETFLTSLSINNNLNQSLNNLGLEMWRDMSFPMGRFSQFLKNDKFLPRLSTLNLKNCIFEDVQLADILLALSYKSERGSFACSTGTGSTIRPQSSLLVLNLFNTLPIGDQVYMSRAALVKLLRSEYSSLQRLTLPHTMIKKETIEQLSEAYFSRPDCPLSVLDFSEYEKPLDEDVIKSLAKWAVQAQPRLHIEFSNDADRELFEQCQKKLYDRSCTVM